MPDQRRPYQGARHGEPRGGRSRLPAPKEGDVLNGIIEQTQYGIRFKKDRAGGNFGGGNPRAAALQAAATFCVGKAQIMAMADPEKALEYLTGKHTTEVAMGFLTFLNGNQNAANSPQNAAGSTTNGQFDNIDDLMPNGDSKAKEEEINLEDIPF